MLKVIFILVSLWTTASFGAGCDCEVQVFPPMTGSFDLGVTTFRNYQLQTFDSYKVKNQWQCREACLNQFHNDLPSEKLNALLISHSQKLINEGAAGYNCTGLTTLKYPVRVKARLGKLGLGNVVDQIEVITHEQICF